jgi:hypothetical protein
VLANRPDLVAMQTDLQALADRIARNREIAGLHYPSDTQAGIDLAGKTHTLLGSLLDPLSPTPSFYQQSLSAAQAEWAP